MDSWTWKRKSLSLAEPATAPAATINLNGEAKYLRPSGIGLGLDRGLCSTKL